MGRCNPADCNHHVSFRRWHFLYKRTRSSEGRRRVGIPERNSRSVLAMFLGSDALSSCNHHSNAGSAWLINIAQEERWRFGFMVTSQSRQHHRPPWKVENGTLVSPGHGPELISDAKFEDFKLQVEFNCAPGSNSGVYLRGHTNFRSKTIRSQRGLLCALEACMVSWPPRRNSRAGRENGRPTTSRSLDEWSPLCKMARPLLTNRKFRASRAGLWIVTKHYPDRSICRVVKPDTSPFGISRLRQRGDQTGESVPPNAAGDLSHLFALHPSDRGARFY